MRLRSRLLLIEGLPGSGKTTTAARARDYLAAKGVRTRLYLEDDLHPADLAWHALIPKESYRQILLRFPELAARIEASAQPEGDGVLVAYNKVEPVNPDFYQRMKAYEVYNQKLPPEQLLTILGARWRRFGEKAVDSGELVIFESAFLQSLTNQFVQDSLTDRRRTNGYLNTLLESVSGLRPHILYLQHGDLRACFRNIAAERRGTNGAEDWIDMAVRWAQTCPYGRAHGLRGFDGLIAINEERRGMELGFLAQCRAGHSIIRYDSHADLWEPVRQVLDRLVGNGDEQP